MMLRTRAALGLRPLTAPVIIFLPLGIVLGPVGVNWLSAGALGHLDVVISIGLATLGVFIGIYLVRRIDARLFYRIAYWLVFLLALQLIWEGSSRLMAG